MTSTPISHDPTGLVPVVKQIERLDGHRARGSGVFFGPPANDLQIVESLIGGPKKTPDPFTLSRWGCALWIVLAWFCVVSPAAAQTARPTALANVSIQQLLDQQIPLELEFRDEAARTVTLGNYFDKQPVILALVYHRCPMLCNEVLRGLCSSASALPFTAGKEFQVVVVSIDPSDTPEMSAAKKASYLKHYAQAKHAGGWHFLTGNQPEITRLAQAVGFHYNYEPQTRQFSHASGIMVLTPQGRLARYFYGIDYPTTDLRLALVEASENRIGSPVDQFLLLCYHYDPATGKYGWAVLGALRIFGALTVLGLGTFITVSIIRDRRGKQLMSRRPPSPLAPG